MSTQVNHLIDAGPKASTGGGFLGKGVKIRGGTYSFSPGEWKRVDSTGDDLRKNIVPLEKSEPSPVLFQLLGLLIEYTNRIAGTVETMVGVNPGQNTPKSNMDNMLEQGMKIYAALFKRTWRAMKEEFRKIYILNAIYAPMQVAQWFKGDPRRCAPVADPNVASDTERRNRALIVAERATIVPGYDPTAVEMNLLRTLGIETPEQFYKGPPKDSPPDPKIVIEQMRLQSKQLDRELQWKMFLSELIDGQRKTEAEIIKLQADAQAALAAAEDSRDNRIIVAMQTSLALLKQRDEALRARIDQLLKIVELESEPERKTGGTDFIRKLALRAGDPGTLSPLQAQAGATEGAMGAG